MACYLSSSQYLETKHKDEIFDCHNRKGAPVTYKWAMTCFWELPRNKPWLYTYRNKTGTSWLRAWGTWHSSPWLLPARNKSLPSTGSCGRSRSPLAQHTAKLELAYLFHPVKGSNTQTHKAILSNTQTNAAWGACLLASNAALNSKSSGAGNFSPSLFTLELNMDWRNGFKTQC